MMIQVPLNKLEEFRTEDLLLELKLRAITPILIGGYDTETYHKELDLREPLRTSSIKGVMRWWARALIGGAIYREYGVFPTIEIADEYVSCLLGSTRSSSKVAIETHINHKQARLIEFKGEWRKERDRRGREKEKLVRITAWVDQESIGTTDFSRCARLKLLFINPRDPLSGYAPGTEFSLRVYKNAVSDMSDVEKQLAVFSLILGIFFDGIGKIISRGFGKMEIAEVKCGDEIKELEERLRGIFNDVKSSERADDAIKQLLKGAQEKADEYIEEKQLSPASKLSQKPEIEVLDKSYFDYELINKFYNDWQQAVISISRAFLKASWKQYLSMSLKSPGEQLHTWILGLPRSQRRTGYFLLKKNKEEAGRRRSPIRITLVESGEKLRPLLFGFKTYEWEDIIHGRRDRPQLYHFSKLGRKVIRRPVLKLLSKKTIDDVFDDAFNLVRSLLGVGI